MLYLFTQPAFTAILTLIIILLALGVVYIIDAGHADELLNFLGELAS